FGRAGSDLGIVVWAARLHVADAVPASRLYYARKFHEARLVAVVVFCRRLQHPSVGRCARFLQAGQALSRRRHRPLRRGMPESRADLRARLGRTAANQRWSAAARLARRSRRSAPGAADRRRTARAGSANSAAAAAAALLSDWPF